MNADWYVDPLGRYEGRFFDGEQWTAQVKERGRLVVDPDWDREPPAEEPDAEAAPSGDQQNEPHAVGPLPVDTSEFAVPDEIPAAVEPVVPAATISAVVGSGAADYQTESPSRQVAVLEPSVETPPPGAEQADTVVDGIDRPAKSRRGLYAVGVAVVVAGLLLVLLPRLFGSDDVADSNDGTQEVAGTDADSSDESAQAPSDAENDLDQGAESDPDGSEGTGNSVPIDGAVAGPSHESEGQTDPDRIDEPDTEVESTNANDADTAAETESEATGTSDSEPSRTPGIVPGTDAIVVGSLDVLNGIPVLRDLAVWHASSLTGRNVELGDTAGCWFGSIGDAVVQNAHCGPVATTPGAEPRFDLVPLRFEDIESGVIQVRPITDAVVVDAVLPNGLVLVGPGGRIESFSATAGAGSDDVGSDDAGPTTDGRGSRGARDDG